jgi:hypothetical protein
MYKEILDGSSAIDTTVEWVEWSPSVTSCIPLDHYPHLVFRCTFGSCILAIGRSLVDIEGLTYEDRFLMLLDFNPIPIQRGCEERTEEDYYLRLVYKQTEWYSNPASLPEHTFSTNLPCRVFMRRCRPYTADLLLDANTVMWRLVRPFYNAIFVTH